MNWCRIHRQYLIHKVHKGGWMMSTTPPYPQHTTEDRQPTNLADSASRELTYHTLGKRKNIDSNTCRLRKGIC